MWDFDWRIYISYQWNSFIQKNQRKSGWSLESSLTSLHKEWSFPLWTSSVIVTKSAGNFGFGHICWKNPSWKTFFLVQGNQGRFLFEKIVNGAKISELFLEKARTQGYRYASVRDLSELPLYFRFSRETYKRNYETK